MRDNTYMFFDFLNDAAIQKYILDGNLFQAVKVLSIDDAKNAKILVTSTSSLHLVVALSLSKGVIVNVAETYNRMADLPTINWAGYAENMIILAYYNTSSQQTYVGVYNRSENGLVNSYISLAVPYSPVQIANTFIKVLDGSSFHIANIDGRV